MTTKQWRVGLLATHPIQYYCPWYRSLANAVDLHVFFSHRQTADGQAAAGFGVKFEWDVPLLEGYRHSFLTNVAKHPDVGSFWGCNTPGIRTIIENESFDAFIVHGWATRSYWQAMTACWRTGTPLFVRGDSNLQTPRSWWRRAIKTPLFRWFIPRFDGYLVVGARTRDYLLRYGADPARLFDTPHAVDNHFFATRAEALRPARGDLRRRFGLPDDAVVFLFAGRFIDRKRADLFVTSLAAAARRSTRIVGLMVGDGPERAAVEQQVRTLGAPVVFAGFLNQSEMAQAYVASDMLVVPSTWETWGLVVNEAMASGLPAIVSEGVACAGDLVIGGTTGEVFATGDAAALTEALVRCAEDDTHRARLAENSRRHVGRFDIAAATEGTTRALAALARPRRSGVNTAAESQPISLKVRS